MFFSQVNGSKWANEKTNLQGKCILVLSLIWMSSTETIGGKSIGFLVKNGKLSAVMIITIKWNPDEIIMFLTKLLPLFIRFRD